MSVPSGECKICGREVGSDSFCFGCTEYVCAHCDQGLDRGGFHYLDAHTAGRLRYPKPVGPPNTYFHPFWGSTEYPTTELRNGLRVRVAPPSHWEMFKLSLHDWWSYLRGTQGGAHGTDQ